MCSACGILQNRSDWIDGFAGEAEAPHRRLAERRRRIALVNVLLDGSGVRLSEHGRLLVVRSATGSVRLVTDLAHVWRTVDELGRCRVDPLDQNPRSEKTT
jgi:hypothetical protein